MLLPFTSTAYQKAGSGRALFNVDVALHVMGEEKKSELDKVIIKNDTLRKYFPRSYTPKQMEDTIIKLLEQWQRKRQHSEER